MERRSESITYVISQAKMEALSHRSVIQHLRSSLTTSLHHPSKLLCPMTKVYFEWMIILRFDSGSWHEEEVPNRDQMSLHSVTLLTENLIVLPVQWRLCLLSFLLPVCVLSWTCIPFLESRLSFGMILIRVFYQNSMPSITIPGDRIQLPAYLITTLIYVNSWKMLRGTNPYRKPL